MSGNSARAALRSMTAMTSFSGTRLLSTTSVTCRWHKDVKERRVMTHYGYNDSVKRSGALPRISEDDERWDHRPVYTPENPWAQKRALFGQNDYIDILGEDPDAFRPSEVNYEQPEWMREISVKNTAYQSLLHKKRLLEETDYPETHPKTWDELEKMVDRQYKKTRKEWDQYRFANYRGITTQDARGKMFKTKYPF